MYLTKLPIIEHTYGINNTENVRLIVKCHSFYASMEKNLEMSPEIFIYC